MPVITNEPVVINVPDCFTNKDPQYLLILHNDAVVAGVYVVQTLQDVMGFGCDKATQIMLAAHFNGQSVIIQTNKPYAELCEKELQVKGLTVSIRPVGSN